MRHATLLAAAGLVAGCHGIGSAPPRAAPPPERPTCDPGPAPLRRLTSLEYESTVEDLLGDVPEIELPVEPEIDGLDNQAAVQTAPPIRVEAWAALAHELGRRAGTHLDRFLPCAESGAIPDSCAREFAATLGARAFRRPLDRSDVDALVRIWRAADGAHHPRRGVATVVEAILQSPRFLYRIEGSPRGAAPALLDPYETATRLSYLLWGSLPDDALFAAAARGGLRTRADVEREARRMVRDPKAHTAAARFHAEWLGLSALDRVERDTTTYPGFDDALVRSMRAETDAFLDFASWHGGLDALFTSPVTFVDGRLAAFYGIEGVTGDALARVTLPNVRSGLLTQPSLLTLHATGYGSSPVLRGRFVRERLLCEPVPEPPANLVLRAPPDDPAKTTRERFIQHTADPACAGCHVLMDPIGWGFEAYDGVGRHRTAEGSLPIDDSGRIPMGDDEVPFRGPRELGERLAASGGVRDCLARTWFRYAFGREETRADECTIDQIESRIEGTRYDVAEVMVAIATSDALRFRRGSAR